jgi:hypothetical protein
VGSSSNPVPPRLKENIPWLPGWIFQTSRYFHRTFQLNWRFVFLLAQNKIFLFKNHFRGEWGNGTKCCLPWRACSGKLSLKRFGKYEKGWWEIIYFRISLGPFQKVQWNLIKLCCKNVRTYLLVYLNLKHLLSIRPSTCPASNIALSLIPLLLNIKIPIDWFKVCSNIFQLVSCSNLFNKICAVNKTYYISLHRLIHRDHNGHKTAFVCAGRRTDCEQKTSQHAACWK